MTDDDLILVTAATGNTGAPTVKILRDAGRRVRALVHTADERSEALTALGAEVVEGDLLDLHSTSSALASAYNTPCPAWITGLRACNSTWAAAEMS